MQWTTILTVINENLFSFQNISGCDYFHDQPMASLFFHFFDSLLQPFVACFVPLRPLILGIWIPSFATWMTFFVPITAVIDEVCI